MSLRSEVREVRLLLESLATSTIESRPEPPPPVLVHRVTDTAIRALCLELAVETVARGGNAPNNGTVLAVARDYFDFIVGA